MGGEVVFVEARAEEIVRSTCMHDILASEEYAEHFKKKGFHKEQKLRWSVLTCAVEDCFRKNYKYLIRAKQYFSSTDDKWPMSFDNLADEFFENTKEDLRKKFLHQIELSLAELRVSASMVGNTELNWRNVERD